MKLEWRNEEDIGLYECVVTDDYGCSESIFIKVKRTGDYEVDYCRGYSMRETFDDSHTLEQIKTWCEDYLLDGYINLYNRTVADLEKIKSRAEWATQFKEGRNKNDV